MLDKDSPAAWRVADLKNDGNWIFAIDDAARAQLTHAIKTAFVPERPLLNYSRADIDLGAAHAVIAAAIKEAHHGRGFSLVKGLPRAGLTEKEFEFLNWAIGLHTGVARPQGKATQYISPVRDAGTDYRSSGGRGYSSNAKLDFHVDGCDLVTLACYNAARSGGMSMVTSSLSALAALTAAWPHLAEVARENFYFSRQNEQAEDEGPYYGQPLYDEAEGRIFCKWNRNRVQSAQRIEGVPQLTSAQRETMDALDTILQRPDLMFTMHLEPGDLQILNNHTMLHSRTDFVDFDEPEKKRLLYRLWIAPPDGVQLPGSWKDFFRSIAPGTVRGGIRGHNYTAATRAFEMRQAADLGMSTNIA